MGSTNDQSVAAGRSGLLLRVARLRIGALRLLGLLRALRRGVAVLAAALLPAVVGVVEARALEVDRDRVQDPLGGRPALLALGQRLVGHLLDHVEDVSVGA